MSSISPIPTFSPDYSFCKFRIPSIGGRIIWEITNECNYACTYCIFSSTGKKPEGELTTQEIFSALRDLKENNFNHIKFTGGEPFLRPDMIEILSYAKSLGINSDISTNASLITPSIAKELKDLDLDMVHVSLDGHNSASHEAVRGKKSFEKTLKGLALLKDYKIKMRIGCVIHKNNQENLKNIMEFAQNYGAQEIIFSMMETAGRLKNDSPLLSSRTAQSLALEIEAIKKSNSFTIKVSHNLSALIPSLSISPLPSSLDSSINILEEGSPQPLCPGGTKFLFINSLGQVSPCSWVSDKDSSFLSLKIQHEKLEHILLSPKFLELREISKKQLGSCPASRLSPNAPGEKISGEAVVSFHPPLSNSNGRKTNVTLMAVNL